MFCKLKKKDKFYKKQKIIHSKKFLKIFYEKNYLFVKKYSDKLSKKKIKFIELGAGPSFIEKYIPNFIKTDLVKSKNINLIVNATKLPFKKNSIDIFFLNFVMHHINDIKKLFEEMNYCLKKNGFIILIEPNKSIWATFVWKYLHHEGYDVKAGWKNDFANPDEANSAIPWIVFERDKKKFNKLFKNLKIIKKEYFSFLDYILTGGTGKLQLAPNFIINIFQYIEILLKPFHKKYTGLFVKIVLKKMK